MDSDESSTTTHGTKVLGVCCETASEATYSLYQAANDEGDINIWDYGEAIEKAIAHEIDILNISYGSYFRDCLGSGCAFCQATQKAVEEDIIVVNSAGNREKVRSAIFCPGLTEDTICVSGLVSECANNSTPISRGAYCLPNQDPSEEADDTIYCGQQGCGDGESGICIENVVEHPWKGNPTKVGEKPDILAPVHIVGENDDGQAGSEGGTSFAAPLVTAALSIIYSDLAEESVQGLNPYQARQFIRSSATPVRDANTGKLNVIRAYSEFEDRLPATGNAD